MKFLQLVKCTWSLMVLFIWLPWVVTIRSVSHDSYIYLSVVRASNGFFGLTYRVKITERSRERDIPIHTDSDSLSCKGVGLRIGLYGVDSTALLYELFFLL